MSEKRAVEYASRAVELLESEEFAPADKALTLLGLAQVEATLEVANQLKQGMKLDSGGLVGQLDRFEHAALALADALHNSRGGL